MGAKDYSMSDSDASDSDVSTRDVSTRDVSGARSGQGPVMGRPEALRRFPGLDPTTWRDADARFAVRITRSWVDRVADPADPLGLQAFPSAAELREDPGDLPDPVGERTHAPVPWVVQKHPDRVLVLVTRRCHLYCRYCFRREPRAAEDPTPEELAAAIDYARGSGAREVILSGGDPLALSDARLFQIIDALRPAVPVIRVHTRAPITSPDRVTEALVAGLRARAPIWTLVHANHPRELTAEVRDALARLVDAGLPVLNQAVLLRGVNDDVDTLRRLCEDLIAIRVFPYYLHHPDHAPGNAHFRVSIEEGRRIYRALSRQVSGIALPTYVIDPPDGSGKITVAEWARRQAGEDG